MSAATRSFRNISSRKWLFFLLQAAVWTFIFVLPFLLNSSHQSEAQRPKPGRPELGQFMVMHAVTCLIWMTLFYTNSSLLLPRFFNKRKYSRYLTWLSLMLIVLYFVHSIAHHLLLPQVNFRILTSIVVYFFPALFFLAFSTAMAFSLDRLRTDRIAKERENENLKTELLFLRSQVSPHFLFNVLNNMVSLARKGSDQLEPSLIKLSSLLRYMLYEAAEEKVPLKKELEYLQSYIDLQTQRFRKNLEVNYNPGTIDDHYLLEPMLLIPFVENAFKHGVSGTPDALIQIDLSAVKGVLQLLVRNKYITAPEAVKDKDSGIGLTNVRRRLSLLYPERHTLVINQKDDWFTVSLTINLH